MKVNIGDKFYKFSEGEKFDIIRIVKIKNSQSVMCINETSKEKSKLFIDDIEKQYTRLKPDGFLNFSIVSIEGGMKDVLITLHRKDDLADGNNLPYAVCRQNIYDVFTNQIQKGEEIQYIGVSVSIDTIPADVPYNMTVACNSLEYNTLISVYLDDDLNTLLSLVPRKDKYNEVLNNMYSKLSKDPKIQGYCKTLEELLSDNVFIYDFRKAFNIEMIDFEVSIEEDSSLYIPQRIILEDLFKVEMFKTYVIKYDKTINLKKIQRDYVIIADINNDIYIIAYDKGNYINRTYKDNIKDKRDAIALLKYKKSSTKL